MDDRERDKNEKFNLEEKNFLIEKARLTEEANKSQKGYLDLLESTHKLEKLINVAFNQREDLIEVINSGVEDGVKLTTDELIIKEKLLEEANYTIKAGEKQLDIQQAALRNANSLLGVAKEMGAQAKALGKLLVDQKGYLLDQQKSVKETELSMGVLSTQAGAFRNNIYKTSVATSLIGVSTQDLAKIQGTYSESIGRSVTLSEEQLTAVAQLAKGTTLGAEGAAEFAASMENFGISAKGSADLVEGMLKSSHKMGVNASKVIKTVQKNMKLAQKYHFKGGIEGLAKMAALTTKFKIEMESVAGFADKLMTPEGAVEAAAKLQVLGGEWAKLGDPFELMFRSRNDLEGLTKDIIDAATGTARLDKATGEIKIDPMELHRLREVANVTGISADELARMAKEKAKFDAIKGEIRGSSFSDEDKEYVASLAQFDKESGKFEITYKDDSGKMVTKAVDDLSSMNHTTIERLKDEQATLEERARQSLTFAETWDNLMNTFKSALLPGFEIIATKLQDWVTSLEPLMKTITDWMVEEPGWVAKIGAVVAVTTILGKRAWWMLKGAWLGMGFNKTAKVNGGVSSVGGTGGVQPPFIGPQNKPQPMSTMDKLKGKGFKGGKYAMGTKGSIGAGIGLGVAGMGVDYLRGKMDDPDSTGGKWAGVGSSALTGAGMGMVLGPWGAAVGGLLGGIYGAVKEFGTESKNAEPNSMNDFISRPGSEPVSFSGDDTLVGAKSGGPIDKMLGDGVNARPSDDLGSMNKDKYLGFDGSLLKELVNKNEGDIVEGKPSDNSALINQDKYFGLSIGLLKELVNKNEGDTIIEGKPSDNSALINQDKYFGLSIGLLKELVNKNEGDTIVEGKSSDDLRLMNRNKSLGFDGALLKELINKDNDKTLVEGKPSNDSAPINQDKYLGFGGALLKELINKNEGDTIVEGKPSNDAIDEGKYLGFGEDLLKKLDDKGDKTLVEGNPRNDLGSMNEDKSLIHSPLDLLKKLNNKGDDKSLVNTNASKVAVEFNKPLAIEGKFELISNNSKVSIDLDDPILMRELSKQIQIELTSAISGGKISSNPVINN